MTVKKNLFIFLFLGGLFAAPLISQERSDGIDQRGQQLVYTPAQQKLLIPAENIKLIPEEDSEKGGFHLYVKKTEGIESILLTETTKDPYGKIDNYAYRAKEYNPINGDEIRMLDGKKLESKYAQYSLVDSTVEDTEFFGPAFHIYIPQTLVYGYDWTRHGEVKIGKGTFISIRAYSKPYADYSGDYLDNPFMFNLIKHKIPKPAPIAPEPEPLVELTDEYNPIASEKFKEITDDEMIYSKGPATIVEDILGIIDNFDKTKPLDFVLAIDSTGSMKDDIDELKARLKPALRKLFGESPNARFGLLFYRDYGDTYKYMGLPVKVFIFTQSYDIFQQNLDSVYIRGTEGGDVPEAVYEAMYASCQFYTWRKEADKHVILIGDAEPHPFPRGSGKYSKEYVMGIAKEKGIKTHAILLPSK